MADTGVKYPTGFSTIKETGDDNDWVNPSNVGADDAAYAYITAATFDSGDVSYLLQVIGFGTYPLYMNIPAGATIDGIKVEIERYYANGQVIDVDVCLTKDGSARVGDDKSAGANFPTSPAVTSFGGATDKWGTTWTAAEVNAETFGVLYKMGASANDADGYVDFIRITVYYTVTAQTSYQTITATAIGVPVLSKANSFYRTLPSTAIALPLVNKGMYLPLNATAIGVALLSTAKMLSQAIDAVALGIVTLTKVTTYSQIISATALGIAILARTATHYLTLGATAVGLPQFVKTISKTLSATAIGSAVLSTIKTIKQSISATAVGMAVLDEVLIAGRTLSATATVTAGIITKFIQGAITRIRGWFK